MKKVIKVEVDCALCANKIQEAVAKVDGVHSVTVNVLTQKMIIDIDDNRFDEVFKNVVKAAKRVEPDFEVLG